MTGQAWDSCSPEPSGSGSLTWRGASPPAAIVLQFLICNFVRSHKALSTAPLLHGCQVANGGGVPMSMAAHKTWWEFQVVPRWQGPEQGHMAWARQVVVQRLQAAEGSPSPLPHCGEASREFSAQPGVHAVLFFQ